MNQIRWGPGLYDPSGARGCASAASSSRATARSRPANLHDPTLKEVAEAHGTTAAQVIMAWHIAHGFVVIPKSARRERILGNAEAIRIPLTVQEVEAIDGSSRVT